MIGVAAGSVLATVALTPEQVLRLMALAADPSSVLYQARAQA
jgi:hypothetical protein